MFQIIIHKIVIKVNHRIQVNIIIHLILKKNEPIKNDATLSSLNVKNYDIGFDKNKEEYNIEIENYINSLDIDAKANMSTHSLGL